MIDNYTRTAMFLRAVTVVMLTVVLIKQLKLMQPRTKVQWVKFLLIGLVTLMLSNAILSLTLNFFRQEDGNLSATARHTSLVVNALAGLASATGYFILYFRKDD